MGWAMEHARQNDLLLSSLRRDLSLLQIHRRDLVRLRSCSYLLFFVELQICKN